MLWRATDLLSVIGESHSSARTFTYNSLFRFRGRYAAECESGGSDKEMRRRTAIDRRASEESAARIPLQCTGAACHFAKAANAARDGCIQATGRPAAAASISPAANQKCRLSPEPIAAPAARRGVISASSAESEAPVVRLGCLDHGG